VTLSLLTCRLCSALALSLLLACILGLWWERCAWSKPGGRSTVGCRHPGSRLLGAGRSGRTEKHDFAFSLPYLCPMPRLWRLRLHDPHTRHRPCHDPLEAFDRDTAVDNPILDHRVVRDMLRDLDECHIAGRRGNVGADTGGQHATFLHKAKPGWLDMHMHMPCPELNARADHDLGWQRGPPDPTGCMAPDHPGGSPHGARDPDPAMRGNEGPASVMKRCPAPRLLRDPRPAVTGVYPAPLRVRAPSRGNIVRDPRLSILW
jgi:hypothetical protein